MKITLKGIAIVGASAVGGMLWYEYMLQKACNMGKMYRSMKQNDGTYMVHGSIDAIDPVDRDKIYTAAAGASDE